MVKAAANQGWINEAQITNEILSSINVLELILSLHIWQSQVQK